MLRVMKLFFTEHFVVWVVACFQHIAAEFEARGVCHEELVTTLDTKRLHGCVHTKSRREVGTRGADQEDEGTRVLAQADAGLPGVSCRSTSSHVGTNIASSAPRTCDVESTRWSPNRLSTCQSTASFPADAHSTNFGHSAEELHSYTKFRQCGPRSKVEFSSYNQFTREVCAP